ncbi:hypothetical protein ES707_05801 [subsurface metagenome]
MVIFLLFSLAIGLLWLGIKYKNLLLAALGGGLLSTAIISVTFQWFTVWETEQRLHHLFKTELLKQDIRIQNKLLQTLILNKAAIKEIISSSEGDNILKLLIQQRLNDDRMGDEIYKGFLQEIFKHQSRWYNRHHTTTLSILNGEEFNQDFKSRHYRLTIHVVYETYLRKINFNYAYFSCKEKFDKAVAVGDYEYSFLMDFLPKEFTISQKISKFLFNVKYVKVTHRFNELVLKENILSSFQTEQAKLPCTYVYTHNDLKKITGERVTVEYLIETLIPKYDQRFFTKIAWPTYGTVDSLIYANTGIKEVSVREFFVSSQRAKIQYLPSENPCSVEVSINEWVFPESGIVYVWTFE